MPVRVCEICEKNFMKGFSQKTELIVNGKTRETQITDLCQNCAPVYAEFFKQFVDERVKKNRTKK